MCVSNGMTLYYFTLDALSLLALFVVIINCTCIKWELVKGHQSCFTRAAVMPTQQSLKHTYVYLLVQECSFRRRRNHVHGVHGCKELELKTLPEILKKCNLMFKNIMFI